MLRATTVPGLQLYGDANHVSGSYEDDGTHAGHRLEPCPFCGGKRLELANTHTPSYWVVCRKCDAEAHGNLPAGGGDLITTDRAALRLHLRAMRSAVRKWNRRAIAPCDAPPRLDLIALLDAMDAAGFTQAERNNLRLRNVAVALLTNNGGASCA